MKGLSPFMGYARITQPSIMSTRCGWRSRFSSTLEGGTSLSARLDNLRDQAGQTMAEYAVVLAVITIAVVVTLGLLSTAISHQLNSVVGIL
jgi:Flp pilus assembly pilin Flp